MSVDASIPKALYQANIDLALRIAALLQENGKQWFDLFAEEASTRLEEGLSQVAGFGQSLSLEKLSSLPADAATQLLQVDMGRWQALLASAVENQSHFAEGVQQALKQWQGACSNAFDVADFGQLPQMPTSLAVLPGLSDMAASIRHFMAQTMPAMDAFVTPARPAPEPKAAARQPADVQSAVKKSATKKPAAKKPDAAKAAKAPVTRSAKKPKEELATKPAAKKPAAKPLKRASSEAVSRMPPPLASTLAPKPLPAVVTLSRRAKKPAS